MIVQQAFPSFTFRFRLVEMKIRRMEKEERKIGKKVLFSLVWFRRENKRELKQ